MVHAEAAKAGQIGADSILPIGRFDASKRGIYVTGSVNLRAIRWRLGPGGILAGSTSLFDCITESCR